MEIIRGRLSEKDFLPPHLRYNSGTDTVQFSPDNGATWNDDPYDDPRHSAKFAKPIPPAPDVRCDSAANMVKWLRDFIEYETTILTAGATVVTIYNAVFTLLDVLAPWAILVQLVIDLAGLIFDVGSTALAAAFTETEYDALLCIFYCDIGSGGTVAPAQLVKIEDDITAGLNTTAALVVNAILFVQGEIGLQNAGAIGSQTGDCSGCACGWCYQMTDASRLSEWNAETFGTATATYSAGAWHSALNGSTAALWISWTLGATANFTDAAITVYDGSGLNRSIYINGDGSAFSGTLVWNNGSLVGGTLPADVDRIDVYLIQAFDPTPRTLSGMQYSGVGDPPFGDDNC